MGEELPADLRVHGPVIGPAVPQQAAQDADRQEERFQAAWAQRQVILFCAPCGCGKSAAALLLLEPYTICRWDALESEGQQLFRCLLVQHQVLGLKDLHPALVPEGHQPFAPAGALHHLPLGRAGVRAPGAAP